MMIRHHTASALLALLAITASSVSRPAWAAAGCSFPDGAVPTDASLPNVAKAIAAGQPVRIVAVGAGTVTGMGLSSRDAAFPERLAERLRNVQKVPSVVVVNKGKPGVNTSAISDNLARDVAPEHPTLVLWETGALEAMMNADPRQMSSDLERGIGVLTGGHADVIVIDMPYSAAAAQMIPLEPYLDAVRIAAGNAGAPLLDRYAAMKSWSEQDSMDMDNLPPDQRVHMADVVEDCVGEGLDQIVVRAMMHTDAPK